MAEKKTPQASLGQAASEDSFEMIQKSELQALRNSVKMAISAEVGYVRVGFDFEGTLIDTGGLYTTIQNEQMDARYNPDGKTPWDARKHYVLRKDLKGQRTWYLSAGITQDALGEMMYSEFTRVANGRADRMLAIDDPNNFLQVFRNFEGTGILTAAPHAMEDRIKGYLKHPWVVGEYYYPRGKDGKLDYGAGVKVQVDCDSWKGTIEKYNAESQKRYNVLIDDSGILGKHVFEAWVENKVETLQTAVIKLLLIENPENGTLMERVKARPELATYGVITLVKDVNEAIETVNILSELIKRCSLEPGALVEGISVGQLIFYSHLQALENIRRRELEDMEVLHAAVDQEFLANLEKMKHEEIMSLLGLKQGRGETFKLPNNSGLDLDIIEKRIEKQRRERKIAKLKTERDELKELVPEKQRGSLPKKELVIEEQKKDYEKKLGEQNKKTKRKSAI